MDFYERVKLVAKERGLSISFLLSECELSYNTWKGYKFQGNLPRADVVYKISKILGVTMEYLIADES